ncbi:MAG: sigma-70 family RNA polymerase sigma factor, partial [Planctomycetota bacterium JB042]
CSSDLGAARFSARWAEVAPAVFAWASLRVPAPLRPRLDPDDLVQEVCCRAFLGIDRFDPAKGPFRAWAFGIAHHVLQAALFELARGPTVARAPALDEGSRFLDRVPDDATAISRRLARREEFTRFLDVARELDEEDRRLLLLRGLEDLPHEEVARDLGLTPASARKRWERLRARLEGMADATGLRLGDTV